MKLCECKEGQKVYIKAINLDDLTKKRLEIIGFVQGETALITKESHGSVLCVMNGKMLALGKPLTQEVTVDACGYSR